MGQISELLTNNLTAETYIRILDFFKSTHLFALRLVLGASGPGRARLSVGGTPFWGKKQPLETLSQTQGSKKKIGGLRRRSEPE